MSTPLPFDKISVERVLEKIQESKREEFKKQFQELEALRIQDPDHMVKHLEVVINQRKKDLKIIEQRIKEIEGSEDNDTKKKTGILFYKEKLREAEAIDNDEESEKWKQTIIDAEAEIKRLKEISTPAINIKLGEAEQELKDAQKLAEHFNTKKLLLQKALETEGLKDSIYKIDNINCRSLRQTISNSEPENENPNKRQSNFAEPHLTKKQKQEENIKKIGYLNKNPEALAKSLSKEGFKNISKKEGANPEITLEKENTKYIVENNKVTCVPINPNIRESLITMVKLFEECEKHKFVQQGNDPKDFDPSKIKPKATGEHAEEIIKICHELGIGKNIPKNQPPSPTSISNTGGDKPPPTPPPRPFGKK